VLLLSLVTELVAQPVAQLLAQLLAGHLGPLHPAERALTLLLAFGPFVLLGLTILVSRRRNSGDRD
jgi:hypothetical protein